MIFACHPPGLMASWLPGCIGLPEPLGLPGCIGLPGLAALGGLPCTGMSFEASEKECILIDFNEFYWILIDFN